MKVWALWHGGYSYVAGDIHEPFNLEAFDSLNAARAAFRERFYSNSFVRREFAYVGGMEEHYIPNVDATTTMTIWKYDPRNEHDPYPDLMLSIGPRGGIKTESC